MSKQANQKYRKEKERRHLKRAGIDLSANSGRKTGDEDRNNQNNDDRDNVK